MNLLELGCNGKHHWGVTHCYDMNKDLDCPGIVHGDFNVANKLPYGDDYFTKVYASQFIEHVVRVDLLLREVWRVLKPKGVFELWTVHGHNLEVWRDYTHHHGFTLHSFDSVVGFSCLRAEFFGDGINPLSKPCAWMSNLLGKWGEYYLPWLNRFCGLRFVLRKELQS